MATGGSQGRGAGGGEHCRSGILLRFSELLCGLRALFGLGVLRFYIWSFLVECKL